MGLNVRTFRLLSFCLLFHCPRLKSPSHVFIPSPNLKSPSHVFIPNPNLKSPLSKSQSQVPLPNSQYQLLFPCPNLNSPSQIPLSKTLSPSSMINLQSIYWQ